MIADQDTLLDRATKAWLRHCKRIGGAQVCPSKYLSEVTDKTVKLSNINGILAVYAIKAGKLRRLKS
jgi:hypothetical protein